jgi:hypothetical protein
MGTVGQAKTAPLLIFFIDFTAGADAGHASGFE